MLKKINFNFLRGFFLATFFVSMFLFHSNIAFAEGEKINAGLLSDIWFSELEISSDDSVIIYGSFQNTSGKSLNGEISFLVNDQEISKKDFRVDDGKVLKLETPWKTSAGKFDIKISVNSLMFDSKESSPDLLLSKESLVKIKIKQEIDVQYIKEVGTTVYSEAIKVINKVVDNTNNTLETIKVKETKVAESGGNSGGSVAGESNVTVNSAEGNISGEAGSVGSTGQKGKINIGAVAGSEYAYGDIEGGYQNPDNVVKKEVTVSDLRNRPFDTIKNFFISILQFILKYWQYSLIVILIIIAYFYFKD